MKKKIVSLLLCMSMAASMLAGCGSKTVDATNDKAQSSESKEVVEKSLLKKCTSYDSYGMQSYDEYEYDSQGNKIKETRYKPDGSVLECREYNSYGNIIKWTLSNKITEWEYEYDNQGNKIKECVKDTEGNMQEGYKYKYDSHGNMTEATIFRKDWSDPDPITREYVYEYDSQGNMKKKTYYNGSGSVDYIEEYDSHGNLIKRTEEDSVYEYEYDSHNNKIKETDYYKGSMASFAEYEYDSYGNPKKMIRYHSDGSVESTDEFEIEYDAKGNKIKETEYSGFGTYYWVYEYYN